MDADEFFEHHGIKGMHWGVRRDRGSSDSPSSEEHHDHSKLKKGLIIGGVVVGAAAIAIGTAYVVKNGGIHTSAFKSEDVDRGKALVDNLIKAEEPTSPILATRGLHLGNRFLLKGGLADPLHEYEKAGFSKDAVQMNTHHRYGDRSEKVAVRFLDPKGRKDAAGRPIGMEVILPEHHAAGINSHADAINKAWSLVQDTYDPFYPKKTLT